MKTTKFFFRSALLCLTALVPLIASAQVDYDGFSIGYTGRLDSSSAPNYVLESPIGSEIEFTVFGSGFNAIERSSTFWVRWTNPGDFKSWLSFEDLIESVTNSTFTIDAEDELDDQKTVTISRVVSKLKIPAVGLFRFQVIRDGFVVDNFSINVIDFTTGNMTSAAIRTPTDNSDVSVTQGIQFSTVVQPYYLAEHITVDYFVDGIRVNATPVRSEGRVSEDKAPLFNFKWDKPYVGRVMVTARAQMSNGQYIDTAPVYMNVHPVGSAPFASIETTGGDQWVVGSDAAFTVLAGDSGGVVEKIDFIVNGAVMDTITRTGGRYSRQPWTFEYSFPHPEYYDIYALVEYSTGNRARTNMLSPVIGVGERPVVRIVSPIQGMRFLPGTNLPIIIQAWDKNSLIREMSYFVNDTLVQKSVREVDGNFDPDPLTFSFNFPNPGDYRIYAQATDHTGYISRSEVVTVKVENLDNTIPKVIMTHPLPVGGGDTVNDCSVGSSMYLNAYATDGDGVIREVKFYINGQLIGTSNRHYQNVYSLFFAPTTPGAYVIFAEAIDNHGKRMHSSPLMLNVGPLEANLPTIRMVPFGDDREEVDAGSLIQLKARTFSGLIGVSQVNFFVDGVFVDSSEIGDADGVFSVDYVVKEPGNRLFSARAIQIDPNGMTYDNWVISDALVLNVKATAQNRVFVNRTYRDFYNVEPTQAYLDTEVQSLQSGQKSQAQFVYELVTSPDFLATQEVLMARILLTGALPNWSVLRNDLRTYANGGGLDAVIGFLLPTFQSTLWENKRLPDAFSSDADFRSCFSLLFNQKYGINPTKAQSDRAVMLMKGWGTRGFILEFLRDNDAMIFQNGTVSMLGLPNPPNSNLPDIATAAALQINLLRITPSLNDAKALGAMSLPQQIDTVLNDSRFKSRN